MCVSPSACPACAENLPRNPLPKRLHTAQAGTAASFAAADADADMPDADGAAESLPDASPGADAADTDMALDDDVSCSSGAVDGPVSGSLPVVASFLASCEAAAAADEEEDAAAADEGYGGEFDEGHPGHGDEGDSSWGGHHHQDQQQQADRRQSLLGLGGGGQVRVVEFACLRAGLAGAVSLAAACCGPQRTLRTVVVVD